MPLSSAQLQTLKTAIAANTNQINGVAINTLPNTSDANFAIAFWYNLAASPDFTIWRRRVFLAEIATKLNGTELAGLSSLNHTRLQTVITLLNASGGMDASVTDMRQFFDDIFSGAGGTNTRASLLILWKKLATNIQKLFSTGTGSNAVPATTESNIGDVFLLTSQDVESARNLS